MADKKVEFFSTGSTLLDLAVGGGWALKRVFNIVGDKSTGKTLLAIEAFANFKRTFPKGRMRYAEAESAFDDSYAQTLGFPKEVERPDEQLVTVEDFRNDLYKFVRKGGPSLYILDSLDALSDEAEMKKFEKQMRKKDPVEGEEEAAPEKGSYGTGKAKEMSKLFRLMTQDVEEYNGCLGVVSQIRDNVGVMFGAKQTRSGGHALDFYSSQIIWLSEIKKIIKTFKGTTLPIGVAIQSYTKKLKVGTPFRKCEFDIIFNYGIDDYSSMLTYLQDNGVVAETIKDLKSKLEKAKDKQDYATLDEIGALMKRDCIDIWNKIEEALRPTIQKYR